MTPLYLLKPTLVQASPDLAASTSLSSAVGYPPCISQNCSSSAFDSVECTYLPPPAEVAAEVASVVAAAAAAAVAAAVEAAVEAAGGAEEDGPDTFFGRLAGGGSMPTPAAAAAASSAQGLANRSLFGSTASTVEWLQ